MKLPLESITVKDRRREDYGDIAGLAASIVTYGLLHPIVVDGDGTLVAGERRLRAVQSLGWAAIDVRDLGELSDAERAEIELEENLQRKDLTDHERSKSLVQKAERAAQAISTKLVEKAPQGRKSTYAVPKADVADAVGTSVGSLVRAEQHVETVEQHPELGGLGWKQYHVLEAREKLDKLPEAERPKAVALVTQREISVDPRNAIAIFGNLAQKPAEDRERIFTKAESADSRDRSDALTEAAERPAMPDPRFLLLKDAVATLGKAARMFPGDDMNDRITLARDTVKDVLDALKEYRHDA